MKRIYIDPPHNTGSEGCVYNGFVAQIGMRTHFPSPRTDLSYSLWDRYAKSGVAVENGDADLDFRDLPIKVCCHQGLAKQLDAVHLGLDTAPAVGIHSIFAGWPGRDRAKH